MSAAPRNSGFALIIALLALVAAGKAILYDTLDPDCFWHLRVAEQLQRDGIGPVVDHISFASIKTPWTPYSWLAELGMKAIWDLGGYRAAVLVQAILMGAFVVFVAMSAHELSQRANALANPLAVVLATVFAMYFSLPYLSFRPVTIAIVLLALCTWLVLRDRRLDERSRAVWCIIPIAALITNCHFFSVLVPMGIAALLIGAISERRNVARYSKLLLATIAACAATPMLPGMLQTICHYQFDDPMLRAGIIAEFQPVWAGTLGWLSVGLLVVWLWRLWTNRERLRLGEMLWALGSLILVIRLGRFAPVFAPIGAAVLAASLPRFENVALSRKAVRIAIACVVGLGLIRLAIAFPKSNTSLEAWLNRHGPDTPGYPCAAADFVATNVSPGRIINEFAWGGYLSWKLGPAYPILLDGRTQLYTPDFWRQMYFHQPEGGLRQTLLATNARAAIVPAHRSAFSAELVALGYHSVYRDERAEVLVPGDSQATSSPPQPLSPSWGSAR